MVILSDPTKYDNPLTLFAAVNRCCSVAHVLGVKNYPKGRVCLLLEPLFGHGAV